MLKKKKLAVVLMAVALLGTSGGYVLADGEPSPVKPKASWFDEVKALHKERDFPKALEILKSENQTRSADWNNLMGYTLRNLPQPDNDKAMSFYQTALNIEPDHRGALEYQGRLFLKLGQAQSAEANLARLAKACGPSGCVQYDTLKHEISESKKLTAK